MADQLMVYSTVAAKGALELIAPEFERASGHVAKLKFGTAAELKSEIEKGALFDVALLTSAAVDDLIKQSRITATSKAIVFRSGVGAATKKGGAAPSISTAAELKAALLNTKSVAISTQGASGPIVRQAFEKLGITTEMASKIVLVSDMTAPEAVVRGRAEMAFTQISEILDTPDALLLGPLPADLQTLSVFAAGVSADTKASVVAIEFLKNLASPAAQTHMRAKGLMPN
jgi:molybdate transport system substrate-binding protein